MPSHRLGAREWKLFLTVLCLLPVPAWPADPVATLAASAGRRLGAAPGDASAPQVLRSGVESLEWTVPDLAPGPYRVAMTVRTGNNDADPLNCVRSYRAWVADAGGVEGTPIAFVPDPASPPARVPGQWPQWIGGVAGDARLVLAPGTVLRADCRGVHFAEVREVRILAARDEDLTTVTLSCPRERHLFRVGEQMPLVWSVQSFLPEALSMEATLALEDPYGKTVEERRLTARVAPGGRAEVKAHFAAGLRGPHVAVLNCRRGEIAYRVEQALDVVSVPPAARLSADSPFAVHPAGLDTMYDCGFTWVRLWDTGDVWNSHERAGKGQFGFSATEQKVERFRAQGLQVLAVLAYTPTWASTRPEESHYTGGGAPYPPKDLQDWRDYCREYMTRFRGRIRHYEVWNEPNAGFFMGTAEEYLALLRAAFEVAGQVDPEIRVVGGSGTGDFLPWTETLLKGGAGAFMHILSFHAYTTPQSPEEANLEGRLQRLRELTRQHGVPDLPLWNTEVGYWSDRRNGARPASAAELLAKAPANLRPNWTSDWPYRPIPEDEAAAYTIRHYLLNTAAGVEKVFWYSSATSAFPLLCEDGGLRYACLAIANAAELLDGFRFARRVDLGLSRLHLQLWQRGAETLGVLWHGDRGSREIEFPAGERMASVLDLWGNPLAVAPVDGLLVLEAKREPLFLRAPLATLEAARLRTRQLRIPVTDCHVVRDVNPDNPVKEHTSPAYHGDRRVFGLPAAGDALGWRLAGIRPGLYDLLVELRTGTAADLYGGLSGYRVAVVAGGTPGPVDLEPVTQEALRAVALTTKEGAGRAYGFARAVEPVWLEPGYEVTVAAVVPWGFVGSLMLRDAAVAARVRPLARLEAVPVLDGDLAETAGLRALELNRRRQVVIGVADPFASTAAEDAWRGPGDLSARWWCAASPGGLYVAVEVTDGGGLFPAAGGAYNGDCVELFLDLRAEAQVGTAQMGEGIHQLMLRAPADSATRRCEARFAPGTEAIAVRTAAGWQAEITVPLARTPGSLLGIDLAVDDDDAGTGRKSQLVWHGTSQNFQDPSAYACFAWP